MEKRSRKQRGTKLAAGGTPEATRLLKVERPVSIALEVLTDEERAAVMQALQSYEAFTAFTADPARVVPLSGARNVRTLRVTADLRLVYDEQASGIRVLDLVRADAIDRYATFNYDVFLSHSIRDQDIVERLAMRLRADGLRVWFSEGDQAVLNIDEILAQSRTLVLCMSRNTFGSEWAGLARQTAIFRDPANSNRRFVPARLDDSVNMTLRQFAYVDLRPSAADGYARLLAACRPPFAVATISAERQGKPSDSLVLQGPAAHVGGVAVTEDGRRAVSGSADGTVRIWDLESGRLDASLNAHNGEVTRVAITPDGTLGVSSSKDAAIRVWDLRALRVLATFESPSDVVLDVAIGGNGRRLVAGSKDGRLWVWDLETLSLVSTRDASTGSVTAVAISDDGKLAILGDSDALVRTCYLETGAITVLRGHAGPVTGVALTADCRRAVSCARDNTVRVWNLESGTLSATLEGHTQAVNRVALTPDGRIAASGSRDGTVRVWDVVEGTLMANLEGHSGNVYGVAITPDARRVVSASSDRTIRVWNLAGLLHGRRSLKGAHRYTNAKVVLVGDSGVGKSGLALRLAEGRFTTTASTDAVWATQLRLPESEHRKDQEREIWLWDFAGQADYRLIHQLYLDETALAVLVFDPQSEDPFDALLQWDRALQQASRRPFRKLLVAGRCDRGGPMVSRQRMDRFLIDRGFAGYFETSALLGSGCDELREAIARDVRWDDLPWTASPQIFKVLKDEIVHLKDEGKVLLRISELKQQLEMRLPGETFSIEELRAVSALLAGPGLVWNLDFGDFVLLHPEYVNSYAAAVIRSVRVHADEIGVIEEDLVLSGELNYQGMERLPAADERIVLRAMHQLLVQHGLCLREHTEQGTVLIFPSYFKRERPQMEGHPAPILTYTFTGALEEIYASLVVRLHYTTSFERDQLWRFAADFRTQSGRRVGLTMTKSSPETAQLAIYFETNVPENEQVTFIRYVHEHLESRAAALKRERHYICGNCGYAIENREAVQERISRGLPDIICVSCEARVALWDQIEEKFASEEVQSRVRELQDLALSRIDNSTRELILVGHAHAVTAEAGQSYRAYASSDHGIDGEVEFRDFDGRPSGRLLYVQICLEDSYLHRIDRDGNEILTIRDQRSAVYWQQQAYPVMAVLRSPDGVIRWMDVRGFLRRRAETDDETPGEIVFEGEQFTALSLLRLRDEWLGSPPR